MTAPVLNMTQGLPISEITLHRGETGLGFNIRGGTDIPHFREDTGIFVTKLKEAGAAYRDGRLKEGDKILEVNGHKIQSVTHNEAVQIFITAGETVHLKVQHGAEEYILVTLNFIPEKILCVEQQAIRADFSLEAIARQIYLHKQLEARRGGGGGLIILALLGLAVAAGVGFFIMNKK